MADQTYALKNDASTTVATWVIDVVSEGSVPVSKIMLGDDDTNDGFVSSANPLPVTGTVTANLGATDNAVLDAIAASVAGTLTVASHDVTNAGTFAVQAAQSGSWTVDLGATDNAVLDAIAASLAGTLTVDGSGVTQPVSAAALPLPSGASTSAKQPALGTAGTASTDVITVQGIASMTPLTVDLGSNNDVTLATLPDTAAGDLAAINAALAGTLTVGSHNVTNSGTFAVQATQAGTWNIANVSGTISLPTGAATAAKQPALGTAGTASTDVITVQGIASMTALVVDGSGVTQPVSAASLPLPSGASTAAKQPALGTAGSASTDVITIQGIASMTQLLTYDDLTYNAVVSSNSFLDAINGYISGTSYVDDADWTALTNSHLLIGGVYQSSPGSITDGDTGPFRVNQNGALHIDGTATTQPVSASSLPLPSGASTAANQSTANGLLTTIDADTGSISTNMATVAGAVSGSEMQVDIVSGTVTANLGATDNAVLDNIDTNTSASTSHYRNVDANAEAEIKGSAGVLHWMHVMNMTAAVAYLHLYDATAASVTPGTTTPTYTFPIPTNGDTDGAGFNLPLGPNGQAFANGITMVVTTTIDGSAGDPGTNGVFVNAGYE